MNRQPRPFRLGVEVLPDRELPAAGVAQAGTTLTITGTARNDTIQIVELGLNQMQVQIGSKPVRIYDNVGDIVVRTLGGKDRVFYSIETLALNNRSVTVDLGTGNDLFQTAWTGTALGSSTSIWVNGGNGSDTMTASANGIIPTGEVVGLAFYGGRGVDVIQIAYALSLNGHLNALVDGGKEPDGISVQVNASTGDQGTFLSRVKGGAGNDQLVLALSQPTDPNLPWWENASKVALDGLLDGGGGKDQASATDGVKVFNIP